MKMGKRGRLRSIGYYREGKQNMSHPEKKSTRYVAKYSMTAVAEWHKSTQVGRTYLLKRLFDVVVAGCALLITAPIIVLAAIAIKLNSRGPIFYRGERAGLKGQPFYMYKLRTMRIGDDAPDRRVTATHDDRITAVG
jgi:lipopolysaccharide/colanic/teichoic acid biosynthesis glycosyltransferase